MSFRDFVHEAGQAARVNLVPGLILQAVAISLLAAYYLIPAVRPGFDWFAHLKQDWGYGYSALATAISGGIVPFLYLWLRGSIKHGVGKALLFYIVFWALMGMQVDVLYRFQGELFGQGNELAVLIPKVLVDQGLFTPLWSIPLTTLCYLWKNLDFNFAALRGKIDRKLFLHDIPGMIVPGLDGLAAGGNRHLLSARQPSDSDVQSGAVLLVTAGRSRERAAEPQAGVTR
jgi:hypothetical protein